MKFIYNLAISTIFILMCAFITALIIPLMFSISIACTTSLTIVDCTSTLSFWTFTFILLIFTLWYFYKESKSN